MADTVDLIIKSATTFYNQLKADQNGRYRSWEHCYKCFHDARDNSDPDYDYMSLQLAFYLAKFMYEYFEKLDLKRAFQVVPVPLHKNRIKKRKYNHMELVAEEFCKLSGFTPNFELITRIKDTKPQYKLSRKERMKNLSGAFVVEKTKSLQLPILIIDDICTTGSTFEEMVCALKKEGITDIVCLASSNP